MTLLTLFYSLRPLIPRRLQIRIRRRIAAHKRRGARNIWPIDRRAGDAPPGWAGWPERKRFALVLNHDVDTEKGHDQSRLLSDLEKSLGFRSAFFFVPEGYRVSPELRLQLEEGGFEVGVHGLIHDGKMFSDRRVFQKRAQRVNAYLKEWGARGFSSPSMCRNLEWMSDLDIEYGVSTFDTDVFEPQPEGIQRIFPFWYHGRTGRRGYVEIPYTLPQDHTLFVILREADNRIWKEKLDWIVEKGGMALLLTHPDYMRFRCGPCSLEEYPADMYADLLTYIKSRYAGLYWHPVARDMARFWKDTTPLDKPS
jgi:peptidoglycan/xylan/chitin deacetylase (PgdA/CDA1 family)